MKLLFLICATLSSCVLMLNTTYASATDTIKCPSVEKIRQAASLITEAQYSNSDKKYNASSQGSAIVENNIAWKLGSLYIQTDKPKKAVTIAQERAAKVSQVLYQDASIRDSTYICLYYDGTLQNPYVSVLATAKITKQ
jgi:hypothetical protein